MKELNYRIASEKDLKQLQQVGLLDYGQYKSVIIRENLAKWKTEFKSDDNFLNLLDISTR